MRQKPWGLVSRRKKCARIAKSGCDHCGSEAGSYLRLIDFAYHSTLDWSVMKKKREVATPLVA